MVPGGGPVTAVVPVVFDSRRLDSRTWRITEQAYPAGRSWSVGAGFIDGPATTTTAFAYCS
jgi:hypothetical protein